MEFQFDPTRTVLGTSFTHAGEELFALGERDRLRHALVIGKTGSGKTTLLENIIVQDIYAGSGVAVLDAHGDLSQSLIDNYPSFRARDLVLIDPSHESDRIVTFNPLASVERPRIAFVASSVVGSLKALFGDSWGYRLERILYNAVAALIEAPATSIVCLPRFLKAPDYRQEILRSVEDPIVLEYFASEFDVWDEDFRTTALDPVLNKVEQLLAAPFVRATLGTVASSIDFRAILDNRKVFIANLSKGTLGASHAHVLGGLIVSAFANAAMERGSDTEEHQRIPFFLHIDEFQNFMTQSIAEILSELRKAKLGAVLAHQYLEQAPPALRAAVLGNCGSIVSFAVSAHDAEILGPEIGLKSPAILTDQREGEAWATHASYGGPHHPRLFPPVRINGGGRDAALKQNRLRHTFPRERVDAKINRFLMARRSKEKSKFDPWPPSLRVFRSALQKAMRSHPTQIAISAQATVVTATDVQHVHEAFALQHVAVSSSEEERAEERAIAFKNAIRAAQRRRLIGALERDGVQWVWLMQ